MTDWSRLIQWVNNYFPDPKYSTEEVEDYLEKNVPAFNEMSKKTKRLIIGDWESYVAPQIEEQIESKSPSFWKRIRKFLGRLIGRGGKDK